MPFISIWVHLVWATKKRAPLLTKEMRQQVFKHIKENGLKKGIHVDFVNGHVDHVHCLVSLKSRTNHCPNITATKGRKLFLD